MSPVAAYVNVAFAPSIVIPAPSAAAALLAESAKTIVLSLIESVVELIVVVVPSTCKSPAIITFPVLSPTAAGSIVKLAGPAKYPVVVMFPNVGVAAESTACPIDISPELIITPVPAEN